MSFGTLTSMDWSGGVPARGLTFILLVSLTVRDRVRIYLFSLLTPTFFLIDILVIFPADVGDVNGGLWHFDIELFHRLDDDLRNGEVAKPFAIGGNHEPRRVGRIAFAEHFLKGGLVAGPIFSFRIVRLADFPAPPGIVQAPLETPQLLFLADVQEEFENVGVVRDQPPLEVVDLPVALGPDFFRNQIVDAHDEHIFVMGAVENHHLAALGNLLFDPPQKIVREFLRRRLLETHDAAALRIHCADYMPHDAIFATRIWSLKTDQQRVLLFGVEFKLQLIHLLV